MSSLKLKYGLDEVPPFLELILLGLQWFAIAVPVVLIVGKIVAGLHFSDPGAQIVYIQKIFFITGLSLLAQLLWGHRLPLIIGPATILLVGIVASRDAGLGAIYTAIAVGGLALFLLNIAGLFNYLRRLFTPPVVATILILIAFTLTPMILDLIVAEAAAQQALPNLLFSLIFVLGLFWINRRARGFWSSTLLLWALVVGTVVYLLLFPQSLALTRPEGSFFAGFFRQMNLKPSFDPGVIISFLICFLALSINDLGSIYSVGGILKPDEMPTRVSRGLSLTGLLNFLAGLLGVIGPVNFSLSPGVIASTKCGSRYTLIPAGIILVAIAFMPPAIAFMGAVPPVIIGSILLYIMCSQVAAGLTMALDSEEPFSFERGLVMGLPLMLSIIISFLPDSALNTFPVVLRPVLGNGFVVGVLAVLLMEHLIFRK
ncbi:MAG: purine/pyrimidine permease [Firmicutes bacterium]|nr:purine/pyrimidine permease [Bacillota bacterium]